MVGIPPKPSNKMPNRICVSTASIRRRSLNCVLPPEIVSEMTQSFFITP